MKARTKLLSMLLLVAMCMSFMAVPAYAAGMGEDAVVGRVTMDMMYDEPAMVEEVVTAESAGGNTVVAASDTSANQAKATGAVVLKKTDGTEASYDSLGAALAAANGGDTIQLNTNVSYGSTLTIDKAVTILLNGHTISVSVSAVNAGIDFGSSGATLRGGAVVVNAAPVQVQEGQEPPVYSAGVKGFAALDNVSMTYVGPSKMLSGSITVYGGSYSSDPSAFLTADQEAVVNAEGRYAVRAVEKVETSAPFETEPIEEPAEEAVEPAPVETEPAAEEPAEEEPAAEEPAEDEETDKDELESDEMLVGSEDDLEAAVFARNVGKLVDVKDGDMLKGLKAVTDGGTIALGANATWNIKDSDWPAAVNTLTIDLGIHALLGDVVVPAGKTVNIFGRLNSISGVGNGRVENNLTINGSAVLYEIVTVNGKVTDNGSLTIYGKSVKIPGEMVINGSVEISGGTYGKISGSGTGGITGGTFANAVPSNLMPAGYTSPKQGDVYVVAPNVEARVKTINGAVSFSRNGGNYVEFYKGDAQAANNYSFQFAVAPVDGLKSIAYLEPEQITTTPITGYTYDPATGRVVISKDSVKGILNSFAAGRGYLQFNFDVGGSPVLVEVPINVYPGVSFDPTYYVIDSFQPVVFTLTTCPSASKSYDEPAYITVDLKDGEDPSAKLLSASNYTVSGNKITLNTSYLNYLSAGAHNFDFWYDMDFGKTVRLRCTVTVSVDYKVIEINNVNLYKDKNQANVNWYQYSGKTLSFTANGDPNKFTGVRVDGRLIPAGNYSVIKNTAEGTTTVGLYPGYLATLAYGKHSIDIVFTDGFASAEFSVLNASASPKTGDTNNLALWAGVLVLSGAAVVALIPKKRKQ